jgi:hypothetical protein
MEHLQQQIKTTYSNWLFIKPRLQFCNSKRMKPCFCRRKPIALELPCTLVFGVNTNAHIFAFTKLILERMNKEN